MENKKSEDGLLVLDAKATARMPSPRFIRREIADKYFPGIPPKRRSFVFKHGMALPLSKEEAFALLEQYGKHSGLAIVDKNMKPMKFEDELDTLGRPELVKLGIRYGLEASLKSTEIIKIIREKNISGIEPLTQKEVEKRREIHKTLKFIFGIVKTIREKVEDFSKIEQGKREEDDVYEKRIKGSKNDIETLESNLRSQYKLLNAPAVDWNTGFLWEKHGHRLIEPVPDDVWLDITERKINFNNAPRENLGYSRLFGCKTMDGETAHKIIQPGEYIVVMAQGRLAHFSAAEMPEYGMEIVTEE